MKKFKIFAKGSKTYFTTSLFFPKEIRQEVFTLYSFVRLADDFIDQSNQDVDAFRKFYSDYKKALKGQKVKNDVISDFVLLKKRRNFKDSWVEAFFDAMRADTKKQVYRNISETKKYIYGSAEVIGLMMASIMNLPKESYKYAQLLGRAMQYANFIRDIDEDKKMGRVYLPSLTKKNSNIEKVIKKEIEQYRAWQKTAEKGFKYIPKDYLIPIKTASDMYVWTINKIDEDPKIVFEKKVKPERTYILLILIRNYWDIKFRKQ